MKIRPSVAIIENNRLLVMRYQYSGQNLYQLPGGNVEAMDTLEQTIVRELQEELNLEIKPLHLLFCGQTINSVKQQTILHTIFSAEIIQGNPILNPEQTSALEAVWIPIDSLDKINMYPNIGIFIKEQSNKVYLGSIDQQWL